ncbi:MAG: hypothetical protein A2252_08435 [Elusimicrobia bacterium RIFOXYA2_FULL_39_19]|nr:MAG: hypothetical protein A2252_08435 [Elusimicrobia bacterium RIFOXYA2_FULL_39_19]
MKINKYITIISLVASLSYTAFAGNDTGTTTAAFLKIIPGARPAGMGNAFTAISDDCNAIYTNASGISQVKSLQVSASHIIWFEDITNTSIALVQPMGLNAVGVGINYLSMGAIEARDNFGNIQAENSTVNSNVISLAYSRKISSQFSVGITAKNVTQKLGIYSGYCATTDISSLYKTKAGEGDFSAGIALQNLGSQMTIADVSNPIPAITRVGFCYAPVNILKIAIDIDKSNDSDMKIAAGVEYIYQRAFAFRAGATQIDKLTQMKGVTLGIGTRSTLEKKALWEEGVMEESKEEGSEFDFDYALTLLNEDLGYTHRITLTYKLGNKLR